MNERIKELRKTLGITQQDFAARIGLKRNTIAQYEMGRNLPLDAVIISICREFNVSETWLRTGEGEMFIQLDADAEFAVILGEIAGSDDDIIKKIIKAYWVLNDKEKAAIRKLIDNLSEK